MDKHSAPQTLLEAIRYFKDADVCREFMVEIRWPDGVTCPNCGSKLVTWLENAKLWKCRTKHGQQKFSAKVGTIFEDSPLPLEKWLPVVWLLVNCKNGISSMEVHRDLGVTQKTAWFMLHRVRLALQMGGFVDKMGGPVEADETFIGGKARFMHAADRKRKIKGTGPMGKAVVMGLLARHGKDGHSTVRVEHIGDRKKKTLQSHVRANVEKGSELFTDEFTSYDGLDGEYAHQVINHAEEYVRGNVHTNGMENFWSCTKRAIKGTYVSVEPFHLFRYLDEQTYRFNNRKETDAGRFVQAMRQVVGKRLMYKQLIGNGDGLSSASGSC